MLPLIRQDKDLVLISKKPEGRLRKYDVPLYKRDSGQYVLHRVLKVRKNDYVLCGDNRRHRETGISDRHIIGVLTAVVRDGKKLPTSSLRYRLYSHLWCDLFYVRAFLIWCRDSIKRIKRILCRKQNDVGTKIKNETDNGLNKTDECLIYLISCALHRTEFKAELIDGIDFVALFTLARKHSVAAMVCMALEKTDAFEQADCAVKKLWLDAKNNAVRKNMLLDAESRLLMDEMENAEIRHMPMKGIILKDWYPQYGMREMSDIDILFDKSKREQVKDIFLWHGYSAYAFNKSNHDVYFKPPVYNFEMHANLFDDKNCKDFIEKYHGIEQKLIPYDDKKFRFCFTHEDFYVYTLAHAYKHHCFGGTGIRTLVDIYVMNREIGAAMNREYVNKELKRLGIDAFEKSLRGLSEKIFCDIPLSQIIFSSEERTLLKQCIEVGTYGTFESSINGTLRSIQKNNRPVSAFTKFKYCMKRLFPGREWCKMNYPVVYRYPFLLPAFWVWRFFKKIRVSKEKIKMEISAIIDSE